MERRAFNRNDRDLRHLDGKHEENSEPDVIEAQGLDDRQHNRQRHRRCTLVSKHKNCMVTPCMNPINPDIPLMPVAETGSITETERDGLVALNA